MFTVTSKAKEKLKEALQEQTTDPEVAVRIIHSPSTPGQLKLVLGKEREGDQVVKDEEGIDVLFIGSDLAPGLEGRVLDYQETPQGAGFTISEPAPGA